MSVQAVQALEVERLRTEAVKNPVGIDVEKPMFSWRMDAGDERGVKQTAYEIAVFSDAACTEQVWSSGRVVSDRQIDVAYEGGKLQPPPVIIGPSPYGTTREANPPPPKRPTSKPA